MSNKEEQFQYGQDVIEVYKRLNNLNVFHMATLLESAIEQIIATHFCSDEAKHLSFMSLLFKDGEITFSIKIRMLKKLLKDAYPDLFVDVSIIFNRLDKLREVRNKFAHCELVFESGSSQRIFFKYYKDGRIVEEPVDKSEQIFFTSQAEGCYHVLLYIKDEINNRLSGKGGGLIRNKLEVIKDHWSRMLKRPNEK